MTMSLPSGPADSVCELGTPDSTIRLRLVGCRLEHSRGGMSQVEVDFDDPGTGVRTTGVQLGATSADGDLRLTAQATLDAVVIATRGAIRLELLGVKLVRAFDTTMVVVAVFTPGIKGASTKMVGAAIADHDVPTTTAKATLHAINRLIAPFLSGFAA